MGVERERIMAGTEAVWAARCLLRAARQGVLATQDAGQPHAGLVTPATAPDASPLLLLSSLALHTRQLRREPRCALLVAGEAAAANPQTAPRLTLEGRAEEDPDPALKARWLALHPYAAAYADFTDFTLWRLAVTGVRWVGGFARAARIPPSRFLPPADAVAAVAAAAPGILGHCNRDHADVLAALAGGASGRMVGVDIDGCDLAVDDGCDLATEARIVRVAWRAPVADAMGVRAELIRLAGATRASS